MFRRWGWGRGGRAGHGGGARGAFAYECRLGPVLSKAPWHGAAGWRWGVASRGSPFRASYT